MTSPEDLGEAPPLRRGRRRALVALLLIAVLVMAAWQAVPAIAAMILRDRLIAAGLPQPRFSVGAVGWHRMVISGLHIGDADEIAIDRLVIEYDPLKLLELHVRRLEASGGHVIASLGDGKLSLGSLDRWLERRGNGSGTVRMPPQISIADIGLSVTVPGGLATLSLTGDFDTDAAKRFGGHVGVSGTLALGDFTSRIAGRVEALVPPAAPPTMTMQVDLVEPRYGDAKFAPGQFLLEATADGGSTKLRLGGAADPFMVAADLAVTLHDGRAQLGGTASVAASADAPIWSLFGLPRPQHGQLTLAASLSGGFADAGLDPRHAEWNGSLNARLDDGEWPGLVGDVTIGGIVGLAGRGGTISVTLPGDLAVKATPDGEPLQSLPAALSRLLGGELAMTLKLPTPAVLSFDHGAPRLETALQATIVRDRTRLAAALKGAGGASDFAGTYELSLATPQLAIGRIQLGDVAADLGGPLNLTRNGVQLRLANGHRVTAKRATIAASGSRLRDVVLPLQATTDPFASFAWGGSGGMRIAHALSVGPVELAELQFAELPDTPVDIAWPSLTVAGQWSRATGYRGTGRVVDGRIALPQRRIVGTGLAADFRLGGDADLQAALQVGRIADQANPAAFAPLRLDGTARLVGDRIDFSTGLSDPSGHVGLVIAGTHALSSRTGSATLFSRPINFTPAGLQPRDLLPILGDALQAATGAVELRGALGWHDGTQTCDLRLLLQDLSFRTRQAAIGRINGVVAFDRLSPLTTPPHQKIAVAYVDLGLPLTDGLVDLQLRPGPLLEIDGGTFRVAGGTASLDPVTLGVGGVQELRLAAADIDLDQLLTLSSIAGLHAKGRVAGAIPLVVGPGFVEARGGRLDATGPGWLGYPTDQPPPALQAAGEAGRLDWAALANLRYEQLRLTFDRDAAGRVSIGLGVKGKNPSLSNGATVDVGVDLTGEIEHDPPRGPASYRLPDSIREQQSSFRN